MCFPHIEWRMRGYTFATYSPTGKERRGETVPLQLILALEKGRASSSATYSYLQGKRGYTSATCFPSLKRKKGTILSYVGNAPLLPIARSEVRRGRDLYYLLFSNNPNESL